MIVVKKKFLLPVSSSIHTLLLLTHISMAPSLTGAGYSRTKHREDHEATSQSAPNLK
jgi:hypothetical protein